MRIELLERRSDLTAEEVLAAAELPSALLPLAQRALAVALDSAAQNGLVRRKVRIEVPELPKLVLDGTLAVGAMVLPVTPYRVTQVTLAGVAVPDASFRCIGSVLVVVSDLIGPWVDLVLEAGLGRDPTAEERAAIVEDARARLYEGRL